MDNNQFPQTPQPVAPQPQPMPIMQAQSGQIGQPAPVDATGAVTSTPDNNTAVSEPQSKAGLIKTIAIIIVSLIAVTFIGLFIWKNMQYGAASTDVQAQIDKAVAVAKDEQAIQLEEEFSQREKEPFRTFSGPADYGQLTFNYPKTWSVYIAQDAANGGDFSAYFNPIEVNAISKDEIYALRLTIRNRDFESVTAEYQRAIDGKDHSLSVETVQYNNFTANRYVGTIPNTEFSGMIVIFKIRDKTVIMQTDTMLFEADFNKVLESVEFNA